MQKFNLNFPPPFSLSPSPTLSLSLFFLPLVSSARAPPPLAPPLLRRRRLPLQPPPPPSRLSPLPSPPCRVHHPPTRASTPPCCFLYSGAPLPSPFSPATTAQHQPHPLLPFPSPSLLLPFSATRGGPPPWHHPSAPPPLSVPATSSRRLGLQRSLWSEEVSHAKTFRRPNSSFVG